MKRLIKIRELEEWLEVQKKEYEKKALDEMERLVDMFDRGHYWVVDQISQSFAFYLGILEFIEMTKIYLANRKNEKPQKCRRKKGESR